MLSHLKKKWLDKKVKKKVCEMKPKCLVGEKTSISPERCCRVVVGGFFCRTSKNYSKKASFFANFRGEIEEGVVGGVGGYLLSG